MTSPDGTPFVAADTGRPIEAGITSNMTDYYAFNNLKYQYSLSSTTPGAILEMGFLTNTTDLNFLVGQKEKIARGITDSILTFLKEEKDPVVPYAHLPALLVRVPENGLVPVYESGSNKVVAYVNSGQYFAFFEPQGDFYTIWLPVLNQLGQVKATQASVTGN